MRYCSGNGDFVLCGAKRQVVDSDKGSYRTLYLWGGFYQLKRWTVPLHRLIIEAIVLFWTSSAQASQLRCSAYAVKWLLYGVDVYFERSGRRSLPNMPCRLRGSGFCRGVPRGTFLITRSEAHCIYIAKLASLSTLVKGKTRSLRQSSFFSLRRKKSIVLWTLVG